MEVHGLLSNAHEVTDKFQSDTGKAVVAKRMRTDVERQCLSQGQGAVFFAHPSSGKLAPFGVVTVKIVSFNDMCGSFADALRSRVVGLDVASLSVSMGIVGSPLTFSATNPGMITNEIPRSMPEAHPLALPPTTPQPKMYWRPVTSTSEPHTRMVRVDNTGPIDIRLHWNLYNHAEIDADKIVSVEVTPGPSGQVETGVGAYLVPGAVNFPFRVEPKELLVPKRGFASVKVVFDATKLKVGFIKASIIIIILTNSS